MTYTVLTYGAAALRRKAERVTDVDESTRKIVRDMLATLYESRGLGLAAAQVGRTEAVCVIDIPAAQDTQDGVRQNPGIAMPLVLVNPELKATKGEQLGQEGCLSFPEIYIQMARAAEVTVAFVTPDNEPKTITVRGLLARAVQHELDHLDGILLVDHMTPVQKVAMSGRLKRLKRAAVD